MSKVDKGKVFYVNPSQSNSGLNTDRLGGFFIVHDYEEVKREPYLDENIEYDEETGEISDSIYSGNNVFPHIFVKKWANGGKSWGVTTNFKCTFTKEEIVKYWDDRVERARKELEDCEKFRIEVLEDAERLMDKPFEHLRKGTSYYDYYPPKEKEASNE
jgi:hypothetical protein